MDTYKDPVCGAPVEGNTARRERLNDQDYYFCSDACWEKFQMNPAPFASGQKPQTA